MAGGRGDGRGGEGGDGTFLEDFSTSTWNSLQKAMQWLFRSSTDEATCISAEDCYACTHNNIWHEVPRDVTAACHFLDIQHMLQATYHSGPCMTALMTRLVSDKESRCWMRFCCHVPEPRCSAPVCSAVSA